MLKVRYTFLWLVLTWALMPHTQASEDGIAWRSFDDAVFAEARRDGKVILLNMEAVWCHWCHVMAAQTYSNAQVHDLIEQHFIPVKVDQDARPDLSTRYRDWGWPATIFLNADGVDIAKRAGFIAPDNFARLLRAIVADPTPEKAATPPQIASFSTSALLSAPLRSVLVEKHQRAQNRTIGGLRTAQKFIDRDSLEYALVRAAQGDQNEAQQAQLTLEGARALLDPAWGGFYQYSTRGDWQHPHFEKLTRIQAAYLRTYALAYGLWKQPEDHRTAMAIVGYMDRFMTSPEGAYYVSQDADLIQGQHAEDFFALTDPERIALGTPRVDKNLYARENGWMIEALAVLYEFTGDQALLNRATKAALWTAQHRRLPSGAFQHDERDPTALYLADNLAMARAQLQLYRVTADRRFLNGARATANYMIAHFQTKDAAVIPVREVSGPLQPLPDIDDNISYARFNNLLFHYTGDRRYRSAAEHAMRFLATESVATRNLTEAGILLADLELANDPLHLTIRAAKNADAAAPLFARALNVPGFYKRIEWWDEAEGPLPNPDVTYPNLPKPAAFVCTNQVCSVPLFTPVDVDGFLAKRLPAIARP